MGLRREADARDHQRFQVMLPVSRRFPIAAPGSGCSQPPGGADVPKDRGQGRSGALALRCDLSFASVRFAINRNVPSKVLSPFTVDHALYARDALAKAIYGHTFTWLVDKINASMENKVGRDRGLPSPNQRMRFFFLAVLSPGFLAEDCDRPFGHLRVRSVLREQVRRNPASQWRSRAGV